MLPSRYRQDSLNQTLPPKTSLWEFDCLTQTKQFYSLSPDHTLTISWRISILPTVSFNVLPNCQRFSKQSNFVLLCLVSCCWLNSFELVLIIVCSPLSIIIKNILLAAMNRNWFLPITSNNTSHSLLLCLLCVFKITLCAESNLTKLSLLLVTAPYRNINLKFNLNSVLLYRRYS